MEIFNLCLLSKGLGIDKGQIVKFFEHVFGELPCCPMCVSLACTFSLLDYITLESDELVLTAARPQNGVTAGYL